jgi:hypothetical protein
MLGLDQLMSGINAGIMSAATITDGKILITSTNNSNLYNMILANLQHNTINVQFGTQISSGQQQTTIAASVTKGM